ncbi:MAG TPA: calcium-binding protein, partial [Burkholderiales bacterium]|nr:calcium-binding protein [Burkholderiales bacterium]
MAKLEFTGFAANMFAPSYGSGALDRAFARFVASAAADNLAIATATRSLIEIQSNLPPALYVQMFGSFSFASDAALLASPLSKVAITFASFGDMPGGTVTLSSINMSFSAYLRTGTTTGILSGNDVIVGSTLGDVLRGYAGNDTLSGGSGADYLLGDAGNDTIHGGTDIADQLAGGLGDDVYILTRDDDVVIERVGEGTDLVQAGVSFTLSGNVENLTLTGSGNTDGTGNGLKNILTGNSGSNRLDGGLGADDLRGGAGNDTYVVDNAGDKVTEAASAGTDTVESSVTYTLGANVENLTLTGDGDINGTGNALVNVLLGNSGNNVLNGGAGADQMSGGAGNDTYIIDNAGDSIAELDGEGIDTARLAENVSSVSATHILLGTGMFANIENAVAVGTGLYMLTGEAGNNSLTGNAANNVLTGNEGSDLLDGGLGNDILDGGSGNDTLDGGAGNDIMAGGEGDDTYFVNAAGDLVTEIDGEGDADTIKSTITLALAANVENLVLLGTAAINGTGNAADNELTGNAGNNVLNGAEGADTLAGLAGNDTYVVDDEDDEIVEALNGGTDLVQAGVSFSLSGNVENLTLTGSGNTDGTGNGLKNILTGNSGSNRLDGGLGADDLRGGAGNDTYVVDNAGDKVTEAANAGTDTVESSVTYTLGANVENLTLTGDGDINGTGNALANVLLGNSGNNVLNGGAGADQMSGGGGNDTYVIDNA